MAYSTGTGANMADFMDALRGFGAGLGWSINRFDASAKRLYMSKGACRICFAWKLTKYDSYDTGVLTTGDEGEIAACLVDSFGTGDNFSAFPGSTSVVDLSPDYYLYSRLSTAMTCMSYMQGPYVGWHLFSNATGDYIHAFVQVAADRYRWLTFGNVDKNGLTHSGCGYVASDSGDYWYKNYPVSRASNNYHSTPTQSARRFDYFGSRGNNSCFQIFSIDALPAGFVNNVGFGSGNGSISSSFIRTQQSALRLTSSAYDLDDYPTAQVYN